VRKLLHLLGRVALGAPFVILGLEAAREPGGRVKAAEKIGVPEPELAVRANATGMVSGGLALGLGILPRWAAGLLAALLIPTTIAGHPYWEESDPAKRAPQRIQFLKNLGLAGALLAYAARKPDNSENSDK
jgi:putative oxidoreductase